MFRILKRPNFWVVLLADAMLVATAYLLSYYLRFDGHIPAKMLASWANSVVWIVPLKLACFYFFGLYKGMWRYTGIYDLENLIKACVISSGIIVFILVLQVRFVGFPRSIFVIDLLLTFLLVSGSRVGIRMFLTSGRVKWTGFFGPVVKSQNLCYWKEKEVRKCGRVSVQNLWQRLPWQRSRAI